MKLSSVRLAPFANEAMELFDKKCQCDDCKKERESLAHKINIGRKRKCNCRSCLAFLDSCPFKSARQTEEWSRLPTGAPINIRIPDYQKFVPITKEEK